MVGMHRYLDHADELTTRGDFRATIPVVPELGLHATDLLCDQRSRNSYGRRGTGIACRNGFPCYLGVGRTKWLRGQQ